MFLVVNGKASEGESDLLLLLCLPSVPCETHGRAEVLWRCYMAAKLARHSLSNGCSWILDFMLFSRNILAGEKAPEKIQRIEGSGACAARHPETRAGLYPALQCLLP